MKKIILFLFIFSLILCFALPAFGSETFTYFFDSNPIYNFTVPSPGNYSCLIEAFYSGVAVDSISFTGSVFVFSSGNNYDDAIYRLFVPPIVFLGQLWNMNVNWVDNPFYPASFIILEDDSLVTLPAGFTFKLTLEKIHNPSFLDSIEFGLTSVFLWIQSFVSSFLTGQLSPLLTIFVLGICIAAIFFAIRYIYKSCWGC